MRDRGLLEVLSRFGVGSGRQHWRRSTGLLAAATLTVTAGILSPHHALAADSTWTLPGSSAVCSGGATAGPTVGQWLAANEPATYSDLSANARAVVNSVYQGTTCTESFYGSIPLGASPSIDPSGSDATSPNGSCPAASNLGTLANPGCVTAETTLNTNYAFAAFGYFAQDLLEANVYLAGDSATWGSPTATSYHDNHGNSWGMAISGFTANESDHTIYATEASGSGSYTWFNPTDVVASAENFESEQVHIGYQATVTQHYPNGTAPTQTLCWFTDYTAFNASAFNGGWCASP